MPKDQVFHRLREFRRRHRRRRRRRSKLNEVRIRTFTNVTLTPLEVRIRNEMLELRDHIAMAREIGHCLISSILPVNSTVRTRFVKTRNCGICGSNLYFLFSIGAFH